MDKMERLECVKDTLHALKNDSTVLGELCLRLQEYVNEERFLPSELHEGAIRHLVSMKEKMDECREGYISLVGSTELPDTYAEADRRLKKQHELYCKEEIVQSAIIFKRLVTDNPLEADALKKAQDRTLIVNPANVTMERCRERYQPYIDFLDALRENDAGARIRYVRKLETHFSPELIAGAVITRDIYDPVESLDSFEEEDLDDYDEGIEESVARPTFLFNEDLDENEEPVRMAAEEAEEYSDTVEELGIAMSDETENCESAPSEYESAEDLNGEDESYDETAEAEECEGGTAVDAGFCGEAAEAEECEGGTTVDAGFCGEAAEADECEGGTTVDAGFCGEAAEADGCEGGTTVDAGFCGKAAEADECASGMSEDAEVREECTESETAYDGSGTAAEAYAAEVAAEAFAAQIAESAKQNAKEAAAKKYAAAEAAEAFAAEAADFVRPADISAPEIVWKTAESEENSPEGITVQDAEDSVRDNLKETVPGPDSCFREIGEQVEEVTEEEPEAETETEAKAQDEASETEAEAENAEEISEIGTEAEIEEISAEDDDDVRNEEEDAAEDEAEDAAEDEAEMSADDEEDTSADAEENIEPEAEPENETETGEPAADPEEAEPAEIETDDYLADFDENYISYYRLASDEESSLKGGNLADWPSGDEEFGIPGVTSILTSLGLYVDTVEEQDRIRGKYENYHVRLSGLSGLPGESESATLSDFRKDACESGFRVVCLYGSFTGEELSRAFREIGNRHHTLILFQNPVTQGVRRSLVKLARRPGLRREFAVLDRVVYTYLEQNYKADETNKMFLDLVMPGRETEY